MILELVLLSLNVAFCMITLYFLSLTVKATKDITQYVQQIDHLNRRLSTLELDFGEKFDNLVRKMTTRHSMRAKRALEQDEEQTLNTNNPIFL